MHLFSQTNPQQYSLVRIFFLNWYRTRVNVKPCDTRAMKFILFEETFFLITMYLVYLLNTQAEQFFEKKNAFSISSLELCNEAMNLTILEEAFFLIMCLIHRSTEDDFQKIYAFFLYKL